MACYLISQWGRVFVMSVSIRVTILQTFHHCCDLLFEFIWGTSRGFISRISLILGNSHYIFSLTTFFIMPKSWPITSACYCLLISVEVQFKCLPSLFVFLMNHQASLSCISSLLSVINCHSMRSYKFIKQSVLWRRCWNLCLVVISLKNIYRLKDFISLGKWSTGEKKI